jgi:hypothetical protein
MWAVGLSPAYAGWNHASPLPPGEAGGYESLARYAGQEPSLSPGLAGGRILHFFSATGFM